MTHFEFAASLRVVADFIEAHPELPLPNERGFNYYHGADSVEDLARFAIAFGTCEKATDTSFFSLQKDFGGFLLRAAALHSQVCTAKVVGKRTIPSSYTPEIEIDIIEWKCPESLLAVGEDKQHE